MKVSIYTTPMCPYCDQEKEFLKENSIEFREFNVAEDREKAKEMIEKSGQRGVPVTVIEKNNDEKIIVGFNKNKLKKILDI